jgi:hypothetical protein
VRLRFGFGRLCSGRSAGQNGSACRAQQPLAAAQRTGSGFLGFHGVSFGKAAIFSACGPTDLSWINFMHKGSVCSVFEDPNPPQQKANPELICINRLTAPIFRMPCKPGHRPFFAP